MKTQLSTKMVGETLEQHCENEFNSLRSTGFQSAFSKKIMMQELAVKEIIYLEIMRMKLKLFQSCLK